MSRPTVRDISLMRLKPRASIVFHLTDMCPVGCEHCSVDSLPRSSRPKPDQVRLVARAIAELTSLEEVVISGGEPFAEPECLRIAVEELRGVAPLVVYTSGFWARARHLPEWITQTLPHLDTVFLSTDRFHAKAIDWSIFRRAARLIVKGGAWLVIQVLDEPASLDPARRALVEEFGADSEGMAYEYSLVKLLPYGRAATIHQAKESGQPLDSFGACGRLFTPLVRFDGRVNACCNEQVITGLAPARMRASVTTEDGLAGVIDGFESDPVIRIMRSPVTGFRALAAVDTIANGSPPDRCATICDACFRVHRDLPPGSSPNLLASLATVSRRAESAGLPRWAIDQVENDMQGGSP